MHSQMKNYQHQTQRFFKKNNCFQLTIPIQNKNIASVAVERNSDVVKTNQKSQPSAFITAMMTNYQIAIEKPRNREFHYLETFKSRETSVKSRQRVKETDDAKSLA
jgi:hypothetical protein